MLIGLLALVGSCADPRNVDVALKEEAPIQKVTSFDQALVDLGRMTQIYGARPLKIQSNDIEDNTGTAALTGGEIPRDVTEMIKSTLNAVGGTVTFIPYNPAYIQNQMVTGYSTFDRKLIPDVVITGGITEFDRGLETRGKNLDVGVETKPFTHAPKWLPGNTIGVEYGEGQKESFSSITLDFNLVDFQTLAGISRMQTVNTVKVHKAVAEKELGFTLFGPTFGLKGSVKKVQGRHAAVRLLVQLSMIQVIGKYLKLPYWQLLPGAEPDPVVAEAVLADYYRLDERSRTGWLQELLYLQGYDVAVSGRLDQRTSEALARFGGGSGSAGAVDGELFLKIYNSVPVTQNSLSRRHLLARAVQPASQAATTRKPAASETKSSQSVSSQPASRPSAPPRQEPSHTTQGGGGKVLSADQW